MCGGGGGGAKWHHEEDLKEPLDNEATNAQSINISRRKKETCHHFRTELL